MFDRFVITPLQHYHYDYYNSLLAFLWAIIFWESGDCDSFTSNKHEE